MTACLTWVLTAAIDDGEALNGYYQWLLEYERKGNRLKANFLGLCPKCFSHLISLVTFCLYLFVQYNIGWLGWWNVLIYFFYIPMGIVLSVFIQKNV